MIYSGTIGGSGVDSDGYECSSFLESWGVDSALGLYFEELSMRVC